MKRRLFNVAAAVSLVLFITSVALWVRSYWRSDALSYHGLNGQRFVQSVPGVLLGGYDNVGSAHRKFKAHSWSAGGMDPPHGTGWLSPLGFGYRRDVTSTATLPADVMKSFETPPPATIVTRWVSRPLWPLVVATAVLPAVWLRSIRRRHRLANAGRCPTCGYDLRATPDLCPECGTVPAEKSESADSRSRGASID